MQDEASAGLLFGLDVIDWSLLVIAIALTQAGSKPALAESDDQLAAIKCPHCGDEDLYRWSARSEHKYAVASAGT